MCKKHYVGSCNRRDFCICPQARCQALSLGGPALQGAGGRMAVAACAAPGASAQRKGFTSADAAVLARVIRDRRSVFPRDFTGAPLDRCVSLRALHCVPLRALHYVSDQGLCCCRQQIAHNCHTRKAEEFLATGCLKSAVRRAQTTCCTLTFCAPENLQGDSGGHARGGEVGSDTRCAFALSCVCTWARNL